MKLLVSDYDGTFYTKKKNCKNVKLNIKKIQEFIDKGNLFMLSSGRSYYSLMEYVWAQKIPVNYVATEDGSHLFDKSGNVLYEEFLDTSILEKLEPLLNLKRHSEVQFGTTREYFYNKIPKQKVSSINLVINEKNINKEFKNEWKKLEKENNDKYGFLRYDYADIHYYCIKPKGIDKSKPIEELSKKLEIPKKDIFTVGDGINDFPMILDYNGYVIGKKEELNKIALHKYKHLHELVDDIENKKVLRRW